MVHHASPHRLGTIKMALVLVLWLSLLPETREPEAIDWQQVWLIIEYVSLCIKVTAPGT